ncbi:MAG: hypothetical protein E6G13_13460 [Actinobacteria bacterium]|nr:MAG: hypothetical protein E6G13_13460 [Actinomycetota bacterium]
MAEEQEQQEQKEQSNGGNDEGARGGMSTAAKAAAAAAATGAATVAVRKVLSRDQSHSNGSSNGSSDGDGEESKTSRSGGGSLLTSVASGGWDAARDALMPIAEDVADAAGKYLASNGPDVVRERIVPRFIQAFNNANDSG